jgi:hypothetical protein
MKIPATRASPFPDKAPSQPLDHPHRSGADPTTQSRAGRPHLFDDRIVPLPEASAITGVSVDTLKRLHKRKELEIIRLSPRRIGIRLSALWAFIDGRAA